MATGTCSARTGCPGWSARRPCTGPWSRSGNPDEVVLQLVELAIRGGGPDNITCIVADVVDSATAPLPPSDTSVMVGAASNGSGGTRFRTDSPAGRAHLLTRTSPQVAVIAHDDPAPRRATEDSGHGHRPAPAPAGQDGPGRPGRADRRRRLRGLAVHPEPVLRGGERRQGRHLPRHQPERGRAEPVQRGPAVQYPGVEAAQHVRQQRAGHHHLQQWPARRAGHSGQHPAGLPALPERRQGGRRVGEAQADQRERSRSTGRLTTKLVKPPKPAIPADCPAPASAATGNGGSS